MFVFTIQRNTNNSKYNYMFQINEMCQQISHYYNYVYNTVKCSCEHYKLLRRVNYYLMYI